MRQQTIRTALGALTALSCLTATAHAQYTVTVLNPVGINKSRAEGAGPGGGVGWIRDLANVHNNAMWWSGSPLSTVNLHPVGASDSAAYGTSTTNQVGEVDAHAALWSGTAASFIDLHPSGFSSSRANASSGPLQVGHATTALGVQHAQLWTGSAASAVDLTPAWADGSAAYGVAGGSQVGSAFGATTGNNDHAVLWSGSAASAVDLHPAGYQGSVAHSSFGGTQVGYATSALGIDHAMLWSGTAASAVDLNPVGFDESIAWGAGSGLQVGWGFGAATGGQEHALLWAGSAGSVVDLHSYLGGLADVPTVSWATGIDPVTGDIYGYGWNDFQKQYALRWSPTLVSSSAPEPGTLAFLALGGTLVLVRRRRK